ncbi:MAG: glycosyltransferase family 2 protein [Thermodesulfobacteriota bacterium]
MSKLVSIIIPFKDEEKYLQKCLNSVTSQTYNNIEIILVDGMSQDNSAKIATNFVALHPNIYIYENQKLNSAAGLNIGIKKSRGEIVIILGAHSEVFPDYVSKSVDLLEKTEAVVVGGVLNTMGNGYFGEIIAVVLSSAFGTGSKFRFKHSPQFVDTVPFGAYRASIFKEIGLFNEDIPRCEDLELNHRIINAGGKIYIHPDIKATYYCRRKLTGFMKQSYGNGYDIVRAFLQNRNAVSIRHLVPFVFLFSIIILLATSCLWRISKILLISVVSVYILSSIFFSIKLSFHYKIKYLPCLPVVFAILHLSYGVGSFVSFIKSFRREILTKLLSFYLFASFALWSFRTHI